MLLFDNLKLDVIGFHESTYRHKLRPLLLICGVGFDTDEVHFTSPQREDGSRVGDDGDVLRRTIHLINSALGY